MSSEHCVTYVSGMDKKGGGGQGGIRTHGDLATSPHFECGALDHYATCPPSGSPIMTEFAWPKWGLSTR